MIFRSYVAVYQRVYAHLEETRRNDGATAAITTSLSPPGPLIAPRYRCVWVRWEVPLKSTWTKGLQLEPIIPGSVSKPCTPGEHQNSWWVDVHSPKNGINRY